MKTKPQKKGIIMAAGNGKISCLPSQIREELNIRLNDGEPGIALVEWLNAKPEVMQVITDRFDGVPVSEQNLSEWRKRGHQQWLAERMIVDELGGLSENAEAIAGTGVNVEKLFLVLTAAYAAMIQTWEITPKDQLSYKMAVYRQLTNGVLALRRGELQAVRLEIARARLELIQEKIRNKSASAGKTLQSSSLETVPADRSCVSGTPGLLQAALQPPASLLTSPASSVDAEAGSQFFGPRFSLPRLPMRWKADRSRDLVENAADYFDLLGLSSLPSDHLETPDSMNLSNQSTGIRANPLSARIQPSKLAA